VRKREKNWCVCVCVREREREREREEMGGGTREMEEVGSVGD
jgi:hypothetical protein